MRIGLLLRRTAAIGLALLCAAAAAPDAAMAQTDAALGCAYAITPERPGAVGHENPVRVTIRDCAYAWDALEVELSRASSSTRLLAPPGYACDDGGFDVLCVRPEPSTAGAAITIRPQCPRGGFTAFRLALTDPSGRRRTGAPKALRCAAPPVRVLAPPSRQSLATALRRGVVTRFACRTACTTKVTLIEDSAAGRRAGARTFRRRGTGRQSGRVRVTSAFRRRWARRPAVWVNVVMTITASTGEQVTLGHDVRLRRP